MLEGRGFVAFGDIVVVEFAFGLNAPGEVFGSGASAFGHHESALTSWLNCGFVSGSPQGGGRLTQCREQRSTAGFCCVGVSGWRGHDKGAVGQLLIAPATRTAPRGFQ